MLHLVVRRAGIQRGRVEFIVGEFQAVRVIVFLVHTHAIQDHRTCVDLFGVGDHRNRDQVFVLCFQHRVQENSGGVFQLAQAVVESHRPRDIEHERDFDFGDAFFGLTMRGHIECREAEATDELRIHLLGRVNGHGAIVQPVVDHDI